MPFTGPAGALLWRLLGIERDACYVTNVRRDYSATHPVPTWAEATEALPHLRAELEATSAHIIVALGAQALFALTGHREISTYRGSVLPCSLVPGRKVLPTFHPSATFQTPEWKYIIAADLRRVKREALTREIKRPHREYILNPDRVDAIELLRGMKDPISVDIETFGDNVSCVGISDDPHRAICFPFIGGRLNPIELVSVWREMDRLFQRAGIIGQNIQFDTTRLERLGFQMPRIEFDTMLAHHLLYPEFDHDLGFIVSLYTEEPYYKDEGGFHGDFERYWTYNCKDSACTYEARNGLLAELDAVSQTAYFQTQVMGLIRPVMSMQQCGLKVDFNRLNAARTRTDLERQLLQLQLDRAAGFDVNVRSTDDMRYLLYDTLGLTPVKTSDKTGKSSTDEGSLRHFAYNSPHADLIRLVIEVRKKRTLLSSFLNLETQEGGRYCASYMIHGTDSGRLSSKASRNVRLEG